MSSTITPFDPTSQNITVLLADGVNSVNITIAALDQFFIYNCRLCINYAAQLGACLIMLIITAVLTKESKRTKPVFVLNVLSLVFGFFRALFLALYCVSPWVELWAYSTSDYSRVPKSAYGTSILGTVLPLFLTATVDASLVLQAHTVSKVMKRKHYYAVTAVSCLVYLFAVSFRFAEAVTNSRAIMSDGSYFAEAWITTATLATETIAIWYFSVIFTGKLVWTIKMRKNMGFQKWSYMQILAAMGGCTMIIPSLFTILEWVTPSDFPEAGTLAMTMVALLLPLSSLWASMSTTDRSASFNLSTLWASRQSQEDMEKNFGSQYTGPSHTQYSTDRKESTAPISPSANIAVVEHTPVKSSRDSTEIDLELMGVRVDRSYDVHSDRISGY
ncbi:G protein-like protein-coupled receptor : STE2 [Mollisia scopiformis]|uniref:G protein-like protein-coupled receptor: STE2 n=1 Tax=Mollisia scopiformis TaxID=149040 RepID=A0A194XDV8_MOLSC|nr:G protein-like protein-coupled receptor : STE2 [Mollisia scopiformis]KUJ18336.1 G protein-like protein-coupled receptor : STE2 [Mollisia scopiformis]